MNRKEAKEFYPFLQAFAEGRVIECKTKPSAVKGTYIPNDWTEMKEIEFWNNTEYRVKPEQKYRPFRDAKECWQEMLKHNPFGWIKCKDTSTINKFMVIGSLANDEVTIRASVRLTYSELVKYYIFADGTPFGVKVGE